MEDKYIKIIGELYTNLRLATEDFEQKLAQKDALIEHLKAENIQLKKAEKGAVEHGVMGA